MYVQDNLNCMEKNNAKQILSVMYGSNNAETDRIP